MSDVPAIARVLAGERRVGPFRIVTELGAGGFAPVFLAVEEHAGVELRTVALKVFDVSSLDKRDAIEGRRPGTSRDRVVAEARALCRVEHPNVVRFLQLVESESILALAMEHVRGRSLDDRIAEARRLSVDATLAVGAALASALASVHAAGLVHRDVKPSNVVETGGSYKLIDFGIAKVDVERSDGRSTAPASDAVVAAAVALPLVGAGATLRLAGEQDTLAVAAGPEPSGGDGTTDEIAGTMGYIDPECVGQGRPATAASDLYSLGALLYECLTGCVPASADVTQPALSTRLRLPVVLGNEPPPSVRALASDVPPDVARLVDALVLPSRGDRPNRAEWVAAELTRLRRAGPTRERALPPSGPFRGLDAFGEGDRDIYFGRAADLASALELLRQRGAVAILGASGSGKTSFVRAALAPAVVDGALGAWPPTFDKVLLSPGGDPGGALREALRPVLGGPVPRDATGIVDALAARVTSSDVGVLVVVDALEELVTLQPGPRAELLARFVEELDAHPRPGVRVVMAGRRDMLDPLLAVGPLVRALTRGALVLSPLTASSLVACMEERLSAYGYRLEDEATHAALVSELTATAESMPLVEFALARLWAERDEGRRVVPRAALARIGGVAGALEQHAESTLGELTRRLGPEAESSARALFLGLTTARGTRRPRRAEELALEDARAVALREVAAAFERARIVVRDEDVLTLAHEALLTQWPRLAGWVAEVRRDRELADDVERAAQRWRAEPRRDLLLRGRTLAEARRIAARGPIVFSADVKGFLAASRRFEWRSTAGVVALAASVVFGAVVFYLVDTSAEKKVADANNEAARFVAPLREAASTPEREYAKAMKQMIEEKTRCEKALAAQRLACDAGDP